jgi:hypothetical protein
VQRAARETEEARRAGEDARYAEAGAAAAAAGVANATIVFRKGEPCIGHPLTKQTLPKDTITLRNLALAAKKATERRKKLGIITEADPCVDVTHRLEVCGWGPVGAPAPDPATGKTPDIPAPAFVGSWVASALLVRPTLRFLRIFRSAAAVADSLREERARVKMYSKGTPLPSGPNPLLRGEAMEAVEKLTAELAAVRKSLAEEERRHLENKDNAQGDCIGSAFITFEHEESMHRALRAYEGSDGVFQFFQRPHLRLRCPAAPGFHPRPDLDSDSACAAVSYADFLSARDPGVLLISGRVVHRGEEGEEGSGGGGGGGGHGHSHGGRPCGGHGH